MARRGKAVFDVEIGAGQLERMAAEWQLLRPHFLDIRRRPAIAVGSVKCVPWSVRDGVDPIWYGCGEVPEEVGSDPAGGFLVQFPKGKSRGPIDRPQQVKLALLGPHLSQIDVEVADRIRLELFPRGLVAIDFRQPADAVTRETTVKRGACQMRYRRL